MTNASSKRTRAPRETVDTAAEKQAKRDLERPIQGNTRRSDFDVFDGNGNFVEKHDR